MTLDTSTSTRPAFRSSGGVGAGSSTVRSVVGRLDELADGVLRSVDVEGHRVALLRSGDQVHAIDNACPHQGYGLATGTVDGTVVTCQWHNWKFDAATGRCLKGEEDVARHAVEVAGDGAVVVSVTTTGAAERREQLWPSLLRGLEADYPGQIARDTVRLLDADATPARILAAGLELAAPRVEDGVAHELAMAADCLAMAEVRTGDDRALPLIHGGPTRRDERPDDLQLRPRPQRQR